MMELIKVYYRDFIYGFEHTEIIFDIWRMQVKGAYPHNDYFWKAVNTECYYENYMLDWKKGDKV